MKVDAQKLSDIEVPWPICDDKLVSDIGIRQMNAQLSWKNMSIYAEGYKLAADRLVSSLQENNFEINFLVYPIIFLYRHYIELSLKIAISYARALEGKSMDFPKHHKIKCLCKELRKRADRIEKIEGDDTFSAVEDLITQFALVDPDSFSFRYPNKKDGTDSLPNDLKRLNLEKFSESMNRLSSFFDGMISQYMEYCDDLRSS